MSNYTEAVEAHLKDLEQVHPGTAEDCRDCAYLDPETGAEGFSRVSCDACGSSLGGDRYAAHGRLPDTSLLVHLSICNDCLVYLANGEEPGENS